MEPYEILLAGDFGWEITLEGVHEHLIAADGKDLDIELSSDGGSVTAMTAIRNAISNYMLANNAKVNIQIIGWAQSAASHFTTLKGATVSVFADSAYMYHNPMTGIFGDHIDFTAQAGKLKTLADVYSLAYSEKSGIDQKDILTQMRAETLLVGAEIVEKGFADVLIDNDENESTQMSDRNNVVKMCAERYAKTNNRLVMSANGKKDTEDLENKNEHVNAPEKKEVNMSDSKKTEPKNPDLVDDKDRAVACMKAQAAMPDQHAVLTKQFEAGMSADHFNGMVAHVDMVAASKKLEDAKKEGVKPVVPKEPEVKPVMKKTAGRSGQTVEVK